MRLINPRVVLRILSTILQLEAISFLLCLPVAVIYSEPLSPFLWSSIITGIVWLVFHFIGKGSETEKIGRRDTFLIVTFAWLLFPLFGALPYIISNSIPGFVNAYFESVSGFTTTGASIIGNVETLPLSILFWRSLTHWIGGLGIFVLVLLILPSLNITGYHLFSLESSLKEKIHPRAKGVGYRILVIYITLTILEIIFLVSGDMNLFDSICHAFGTVATGGFSTKNNSLMHYSAYSQYVVMIFMIMAGTSQVVFYYLFKRNFKKVRRNEELRLYLTVILVAGALAAGILLYETHKPVEEALREGYFQIVSVITCTGFATADYIFWPPAAVFLIFLLMFAGGSTGSTSGGIKMARHLLILKNIKKNIMRSAHPNAISTVRLNGRSVEEQTSLSIFSFIYLYLFLFLLGTMILILFGSDPMTSASSVATCMAGIGPGLGTVGPMSNYAAMPEISKIVLSMAMILGRLEILTVFALFSRSFWKV
jgi:trk system potassium uptake protein TrkH